MTQDDRRKVSTMMMIAGTLSQEVKERKEFLTEIKRIITLNTKSYEEI